MLVSEDLFEPLLDIYRAHNEAVEKDKFLNNKRKPIKIIVDTLWEQIVESLFEIKPTNHLDARRIINSNKYMLTDDEDISVVDSLADVLKGYDVLNEKSYIDHSEQLHDILLVSLRRLCINLSEHKELKKKQKVILLRTMLR